MLKLKFQNFFPPKIKISDAIYIQILIQKLYLDHEKRRDCVFTKNPNLFTPRTGSIQYYFLQTCLQGSLDK